MRRKDAIVLKVIPPSRGLVTRLPSESADRFRPGDAARTFSVASNVRFEDGIVGNAPGYERVRLDTALMVNAISHWKFDEVSGPRRDSIGINHFVEGETSESDFAAPAVDGKLGRAVSFNGAIVPLSAPTNSSLEIGASAFTFTGWFQVVGVPEDARIFTKPGQYTLSTDHDGVLQFRLVTTSGTVTVASSFVVAANTWYFFSISYTGANAIIVVNTTSDSAAQTGTIIPGPDSLVLGGVSDSPSVYLDSMTFWKRLLTGPELTSMFNSNLGLNFPFLVDWCNLIFEGNLITSPFRPLVVGTSNKLFSVSRGFSSNPRRFTATLTELFSGTAGTAGYYWSAMDFYDKIIFAQHNNIPQYLINGGSATAPLPGLAVNADQYSATADGSARFDGVTSFFNHVLLWKDDIVKWSDLDDFSNFVPIGTTVSSATLTVATLFAQPAVGSTVTVTVTEDPVALGITVGQFVRIDVGAAYNFYSVTAATTGPNTVTLRLLGTTGRTASATNIAAGNFILTLDANEAGQTRTVGALVNGPIYQVIPNGDYAYIFKEWSIQSMQYLGFGGGVFYIRTEVTREGPRGRNAVKSLGNGTIVFLGHRELYTYAGGPTPAPVCRQYTRQLFAELDHTRLDEIIITHREPCNEVWVVYPVSGGQKVLIWNYVEDTASIDEYDESLGGLMSAAPVTWTIDPSWGSLAETLLWNTMDALTAWADMVDTGNSEVGLLGMHDGTLLVAGLVYNREGAGYDSLAETMDFDMGDSARFKYMDAIHFGLQVLATDNTTRNLYIQVGYRAALDSDITWTPRRTIAVEGNANFTAKVNPGGAGRYIRARFESNEPDVRWRVSSYQLFARGGGTF